MTLTLLSIHNNLLFFVASVGLIEERYNQQNNLCQVILLVPSKKVTFSVIKRVKLLNLL